MKNAISIAHSGFVFHFLGSKRRNGYINFTLMIQLGFNILFKNIKLDC